MVSPLNFEPDDEIATLVREETDVGLLKLMAGRDQDAAWADAAWCEFFNRHKAYMWTVCDSVAEDLHGDAWIEDIFIQTFERAYERAETFKLSPGTSAGSETRLVRGWLGKIAANILRHLLRNHEAEHTKDEEEWRTILECTEVSNPDEEPNTPELIAKRKFIAEALETLTEREQLVLRTTYQYYRIGKQFQRLPNKISRELADQLATTPENLRKIRERALEKVAAYINEHQQ
jgi:RNA polymerase sigma-70 factor, ECF subfamily